MLRLWEIPQEELAVLDKLAADGKLQSATLSWHVFREYYRDNTKFEKKLGTQSLEKVPRLARTFLAAIRKYPPSEVETEFYDYVHNLPLTTFVHLISVTRLLSVRLLNIFAVRSNEEGLSLDHALKLVDCGAEQLYSHSTYVV